VRREHHEGERSERARDERRHRQRREGHKTEHCDPGYARALGHRRAEVERDREHQVRSGPRREARRPDHMMVSGERARPQRLADCEDERVAGEAERPCDVHRHQLRTVGGLEHVPKVTIWVVMAGRRGMTCRTPAASVESRKASQMYILAPALAGAGCPRSVEAGGRRTEGRFTARAHDGHSSCRSEPPPPCPAVRQESSHRTGGAVGARDVPSPPVRAPAPRVPTRLPTLSLRGGY
jgi:hypothetical protein